MRAPAEAAQTAEKLPMMAAAADNGAAPSMAVHTSSTEHPGPWALDELAGLVASCSLGEGTQLWLEGSSGGVGGHGSAAAAAGQRGHQRYQLAEVVDLEEASEVDATNPEVDSGHVTERRARSVLASDSDFDPTARRWRLSLAQEVGELAEALQEGLATMMEETVGRDYTFVSTPSYTEEELAAIRTTREMLLSGAIEAGGEASVVEAVAAEQIRLLELTVTVMNCKLETDKAAEKYRDYLGVLATYELGLPASVHEDDWGPIESFFKSFTVCGPDKQGRSVMWIK